MEEIWKPIPGYNGYEVSNTGKVKSYKIKKEGVLLTQSVTKRRFTTKSKTNKQYRRTKKYRCSSLSNVGILSY